MRQAIVFGLCAAVLYAYLSSDFKNPAFGRKPDGKPVSAASGQTAPFIAVSVADLDRQLKWYCDNLGFEIHSQGTVPGKGIKFALLKKDSALIELLQIPESKPRPGKPRDPSAASLTQGFFKSGMVAADVEALQARLEKNGADFAFKLSKPTGGPYRVFGVFDPEGNLLQFFGN